MKIAKNVRASKNPSYVQYRYNQKYILSICVLCQSCRLEPSFWNIVTLLINPILSIHSYTLLIYKFATKNQLVRNMLPERLVNTCFQTIKDNYI